MKKIHIKICEVASLFIIIQMTLYTNNLVDANKHFSKKKFLEIKENY